VPLPADDPGSNLADSWLGSTVGSDMALADLAVSDRHEADPARGSRLQRAHEDESTVVSRAMREWGLVALGALVIALVLRLLVVQAYVIPSDSMVPTLVDGDRVVVNRLSYSAGDVERGQVIVFERPPSLPGTDDVIKRVIGLPGETIRFVDDQVYIETKRVVESYLLVPDSTRSKGMIPGCAQDNPAADRCTIPEGFVFVMGDNRVGSDDSRVFGPVEIDTIVGRAFVRVWPVTKLGRL